MKVLRPALASFVLLLCYLTSGCTTGPALKGLSATLVDIKPQSITAAESRFTLTLNYLNENVVPVGLSGASHKLYLNGTYVGEAVSNQPIGLPALNSAKQDATLVVKNDALAGKVKEIVASRRLDYRIESELKVLAGEEKLTVKSEKSGAINLGQ